MICSLISDLILLAMFQSRGGYVNDLFSDQRFNFVSNVSKSRRICE